MKLLAIDCSTDKAEVALASDGVITTESRLGVRTHASLILPMIVELLNKRKLTLAQLDGLVLGQGPGSFTGLRVAASVVQGLSLPHNLPIYPVSGLKAIAYQCYHEKKSKEPILAVIDARMQEVYWAYYSDGTAMEASENLSAMKDISIPLHSPYTLAGVGFEPYLDALPSCLRQKLKSTQSCYPSAIAMLELALSGTIAPVDTEKALPVYIRNQVIQGAKSG